MTDQKSDHFSQADAFRIWPLVVALALVYSMFWLPELIAHLRADDNLPQIQVSFLSLYALAAVMILFGTVAAVVSLIRLRLKSAAAHASAAVLIIAAFFYFGQQLMVMAQLTNLYLFPGTYANCATRATRYGEHSAFNVCNRREDGDSFTMIVYDSGGEIELPVDQRSNEFRNMLTTKASFLSTCRTGAQKLKDNFFFVQAGC